MGKPLSCMIARNASPRIVPLSVPMFINARSFAPGVGIAVSAASVRYVDSFVDKSSRYLSFIASVAFLSLRFLVAFARAKAACSISSSGIVSTAFGVR